MKQINPKEKFINLIDNSLNLMETERDFKKNRRNKELKANLKEVEEFIRKNRNNDKYKNIKDYSFKNISLNPLKRTRLFISSIIIFAISSIIAGYLGKYITRPGFYNFPENTNLNYIFYGLVLISIISFLISFILYRNRNSIHLKVYKYNLKELKRKL